MNPIFKFEIKRYWRRTNGYIVYNKDIGRNPTCSFATSISSSHTLGADALWQQIARQRNTIHIIATGLLQNRLLHLFPTARKAADCSQYEMETVWKCQFNARCTLTRIVPLNLRHNRSLQCTFRFPCFDLETVKDKQLSCIFETSKHCRTNSHNNGETTSIQLKPLVISPTVLHM